MTCAQVMFTYPSFSYNQRAAGNGHAYNSAFTATMTGSCTNYQLNSSPQTINTLNTSNSLNISSLNELPNKKFRGMPKIPDLVDGSTRNSQSVTEFASATVSLPSNSNTNGNTSNSNNNNNANTTDNSNIKINNNNSSTSSSSSVAASSSSSVDETIVANTALSGHSVSVNETVSSPNSSSSSNSIKQEHHHHHHHHKIQYKKSEDNEKSTIPSTSLTSTSQLHSSSVVKDTVLDAQYLSSNCIVYIFYTDVIAAVEDHFNKALNQSSFLSRNKYKDTGPPMSQRNLPPSFWNINHQSTSQTVNSSFCMPTAQSVAGSSHDLYSTADPYHHTGSLHTIHHQNDPWHYSFSASAASNAYAAHHHHHHHRAAAAAAVASATMHDLGYSASTNRFNTQYSSLLLPPPPTHTSIRPTRLTQVNGSCTTFDKTATDMSWPASARYHEAAMNFAGHPAIDPNYSASAAYGAAMSAAMSGLDNQVSEGTGKDLYWF